MCGFQRTDILLFAPNFMVFFYELAIDSMFMHFARNRIRNSAIYVIFVVTLGVKGVTTTRAARGSNRAICTSYLTINGFTTTTYSEKQRRRRQRESNRFCLVGLCIFA